MKKLTIEELIRENARLEAEKLELASSFSSDIAFYAFRYCLGRMTYVVSDCVSYLIKHWDRLYERDKRNIIKEIKEAEARGGLGMDIDKRDWLKILELEGVKEGEE